MLEKLQISSTETVAVAHGYTIGTVIDDYGTLLLETDDKKFIVLIEEKVLEFHVLNQDEDEVWRYHDRTKYMDSKQDNGFSLFAGMRAKVKLKEDLECKEL